MAVSKVKLWGFLFLVFAIFYIVGEFRGKRFKSKIFESSIIVNGNVNNYWVAFAHSNAVDYSFVYNNRIYNSESTNDDYFWLRNYVVHKSFPVILSSLHPEYSHVLILPKEFEEYKVPAPAFSGFSPAVFRPNGQQPRIAVSGIAKSGNFWFIRIR